MAVVIRDPNDFCAAIEDSSLSLLLPSLPAAGLLASSRDSGMSSFEFGDITVFEVDRAGLLICGSSRGFAVTCIY
jgi:hypothetical protein